MANIYKSASELIGGTPILKLNGYGKAAGVTDANILAKLEYLNPAGSVKAEETDVYLDCLVRVIDRMVETA